MKHTFKGSPRIKRVTHELGISIPEAVGHLVCLWTWCMDYTNHGDLTRYDAFDIAGGAMWVGDPEKFLTALVEAGFIKVEPASCDDKSLKPLSLCEFEEIIDVEDPCEGWWMDDN